MRSYIMAGLAGALLLGASSVGASAQAFRIDNDGRAGIERGERGGLDRAERGGFERGDGERRRDRAEGREGRFDQAQRFDREERFERRGGFDRGDRFDRGVDRRVIIRERPTVVVRPPRARTVCTTRIRERVTPGGVVIRRPVEVCRERFGAL